MVLEAFGTILSFLPSRYHPGFNLDLYLKLVGSVDKNLSPNGIWVAGYKFVADTPSALNTSITSPVSTIISWPPVVSEPSSISCWVLANKTALLGSNLITVVITSIIPSF